MLYRRRTSNEGFKAGNVMDFLDHHAPGFALMLLLDADSEMSTATVLRLVRIAQADPRIAILQPTVAGSEATAPFGRLFGFGHRHGSRIWATGQAWWQNEQGPFWGHNALVRTRAFAESCGLPDLSGRAPFGGHILSHDFVEAALLARAGWKVRVHPDLEGSFEEAPSNLIEYAKRDRRWCQGNLQHGRLVPAPGMRLWSRIAMISGIMAYAASPIWLLFLVVSLLDPILTPAPNYFPPDSLFPVFPRPETGRALLLLLGIFLLLLLPKTLIAFRTAFSRRRKAFGGTFAVLLGATVELILTSALAPIMMLFQSKAVAEILMQTDSGWPATDRDDEGLPLKAAFAASWWMVIVGAALLVATWFYAFELFLWVCPIAIPLLIAPLFISATGSPALGDLAQRLSIFMTPFEIAPEPVIRAAAAWRVRLGTPAEARPGVIATPGVASPAHLSAGPA